MFFSIFSKLLAATFLPVISSPGIPKVSFSSSSLSGIPSPSISINFSSSPWSWISISTSSNSSSATMLSPSSSLTAGGSSIILEGAKAFWVALIICALKDFLCDSSVVRDLKSISNTGTIFFNRSSNTLIPVFWWGISSEASLINFLMIERNLFSSKICSSTFFCFFCSLILSALLINFLSFISCINSVLLTILSPSFLTHSSSSLLALIEPPPLKFGSRPSFWVFSTFHLLIISIFCFLVNIG